MPTLFTLGGDTDSGQEPQNRGAKCVFADAGHDIPQPFFLRMDIDIKCRPERFPERKPGADRTMQA